MEVAHRLRMTNRYRLRLFHVKHNYNIDIFVLIGIVFE